MVEIKPGMSQGEREQMEIRVRRLTSNERSQARRLFTMMAAELTENCGPLSDRYLDYLLYRKEFWALAAFSGDEIIRRNYSAYVADDQSRIFGDFHL